VDAGFAIYVARQALYTGLLVMAPCITVALVVGLATSILQAITSVREMTLAMVPKIVAVGLTLVVSMGWMLQIMVTFAMGLLQRISSMGG